MNRQPQQTPIVKIHYLTAQIGKDGRRGVRDAVVYLQQTTLLRHECFAIGGKTHRRGYSQPAKDHRVLKIWRQGGNGLRLVEERRETQNQKRKSQKTKADSMEFRQQRGRVFHRLDRGS